jgi:diacylglycerol kinase (ATP)
MVRFLLNPAGGRGRAARALPRLEELARAARADLVLSRDAADLTAQARRAAADGAERLLVGGGDGTMHYAIEGLAGSSCALGALPLGSGNDIASSLGMPAELGAAVALALCGPVGAIDLARVGGCFYAGVAGVGFDSVANETGNRVKRLKGPLIYVYAVLHTLATFRPPHLSIDHEGGRFEGPAMMALLANTPRFGGGMRVAPEARLDDGLLDLVILRAVRRLTFLAVFPKVYRGAHTTHPAILMARTPWAHVRLDRPMHVYGDGERLTPVPPEGIRFDVVPRGLLAVQAGTTPRTSPPGPAAAPSPS